ncbi:MAG: TIGR03986 family CRISPR-associated RAMP protein [Promethearchaeota archaeon]
MVKIIETQEFFINPYHFIPLMEKCAKDYSITDIINRSNLLTGWIDCKINTLTPIFIPNTTFNDIFGLYNKKKIFSYDFYSYTNLKEMDKKELTNDPVIPGSSIRGIIRSSFETLTNSCLSVIDIDKEIYKRVTTPGEPGMIKKREGDTWEIIRCKKYKINKNRFQNEIRRFEEGQKITFEANRNNYVIRILDPNSNGIKGYFHFGENINRKRNESIFVPKKDDKPIQIGEEELMNYCKNLNLYRNEKVNINLRSEKEEKHYGYNKIKIDVRNLEDIDLNKLDGALVYYKPYNDKLYLGPAEIGREVFHNTLSDIVGSYAPCISDKKLCSGCLLFGFIGPKEKGINKSEKRKIQALASRIQFTDAKCESKEENLFIKEGILPELSSPKLSAVEFYLERPKIRGNFKADLWNYDYAGFWDKNDRNKWKTADRYQAIIRGRKFYWHHEFNPEIFLSEDVATERNVKIRPLKKDLSFKFKIIFNNITPDELKKLLWVIDFGGSNDHAYKIGMGKPYGLGSINITIENLKFRKIVAENNKLNYKIEPDRELIQEVHDQREPWKLLGCSEETLRDFLIITNWKMGFNSQNPVIYPQNAFVSNEKDTFTYKWFMSNKTFKTNAFRPKINKVLPKDISSPFLCKYREERRKN